MNNIEPKFQIYETRNGITTANLVNKVEFMSAKMTLIANINAMRIMIGLGELSFEHQIKRDYDALHDNQNSLIEHYNQALNNGKPSRELNQLK